MISEIDKSISFQNSRNVAAELLKTLKRDVPFETEKDILEAHDRLTQALYKQYCVFIEEGTEVTPVAPVAETEVQKEEVKASKLEAPASITPASINPPKAVTTSEPTVLAMVQKAVDAVATKEACTELKEKILKATKLSLQDQAMLLGKIDAKIAVL